MSVNVVVQSKGLVTRIVCVTIPCVEYATQLSFVVVMRAAVMDGIAIGRPCCGIHDCQNPLPSQRARFCTEHAAHNHICVVLGCDATVTEGFQTCTEPSHRTLEDPSRRSSLFILRRRLERLRAHTLEDDGDGTTDELIEVDDDGECPSKSDEGNVKTRARFGRRRTHNEQLVVATCGVILGRATMYGSEGIDGTRVCIQYSKVSLIYHFAHSACSCSCVHCFQQRNHCHRSCSMTLLASSKSMYSA